MKLDPNSAANPFEPGSPLKRKNFDKLWFRIMLIMLVLVILIFAMFFLFR